MKKQIIGLLASLLLLGGCFNINGKTEQEKAQEGTTPVQEYVGQGYSFVDGNKSAERVKEHEEEIKQEAINYMKTKYKTDVKVNNVVPARNGAVVIVESEAPIQFTTSVVVKFLLNNKDEIGSGTSDEGAVEQAIVGGLYAKAYEEEFEHLDEVAEKLARKNDLEGFTQEALDKTSPSGHQGKYYFITAINDDYLGVYNAYLNNTQISSNELQALFVKDDPTSKNMTIVMNYFSKEDKLPKQAVVDSLAEQFRKESNLPRGFYPINLFKNFIVNRVGLPDGEHIQAEVFIK
ncbi:DUF1672 family protein [Listeria cossartiae subsp. cayugensis]|uniref:DUF1672 family protein n=1 Tax=Listeria cossartiae subsp. cayugensis TaxID=2713505 RepID=A0ABU2INJ1_9LIST|nr:DUF1672 family protein [Listeria cossartiae]MDT0049746.1 DUF1672 family protein [Listeria cossartiae subsp. cayugensis]MDT0066249.1 DUF1672 family protein [Listeria cossartiae subsp. cayugensis]MDT0080138.1 DUF1672 family protein [Listeria cossartiae subsp. cayugensis]MDT0083445.1 DUF1672 family protein [Listeria cossartiae subsp. cayugensis]MDT0088463.1 DUF1672 family protein [Listeria cossartiae subsp. cayugensis]